MTDQRVGVQEQERASNREAGGGNGMKAEGGKDKEFKCPICEKYPKAFAGVTRGCHPGKPFPDLGKLKEHLVRYHNPDQACLTCHRVFPYAKGKAKKEIEDHKCELKPSGLAKNVFLMSKESLNEVNITNWTKDSPEWRQERHARLCELALNGRWYPDLEPDALVTPQSSDSAKDGSPEAAALPAAPTPPQARSLPSAREQTQSPVLPPTPTSLDAQPSVSPETCLQIKRKASASPDGRRPEPPSLRVQTQQHQQQQHQQQQRQHHQTQHEPNQQQHQQPSQHPHFQSQPRKHPPQQQQQANRQPFLSPQVQLVEGLHPVVVPQHQPPLDHHHPETKRLNYYDLDQKQKQYKLPTERPRHPEDWSAGPASYKEQSLPGDTAPSFTHSFTASSLTRPPTVPDLYVKPSLLDMRNTEGGVGLGVSEEEETETGTVRDLAALGQAAAAGWPGNADGGYGYYGYGGGDGDGPGYGVGFVDHGAGRLWTAAGAAMDVDETADIDGTTAPGSVADLGAQERTALPVGPVGAGELIDNDYLLELDNEDIEAALGELFTDWSRL